MDSASSGTWHHIPFYRKEKSSVRKIPEENHSGIIRLVVENIFSQTWFLPDIPDEIDKNHKADTKKKGRQESEKQPPRSEKSSVHGGFAVLFRISILWQGPLQALLFL